MLKKQVPDFYKNRRERLMKAHPSSAFLFPANPETLRNPDVLYPYRQETNFYYLTGFEEPESFLLLLPGENGGSESTLFVRPRDTTSEIWTGERYGPDRAKSIYHFDHVFLIHELPEKLPAYLSRANDIFYHLGHSPEMDQLVLETTKTVQRKWGRSGKGLLTIQDPMEVVGEMRLFKSETEIEYLKKATHLSALAHKQTMIETKPGMNEGQVQAIIEYHFKKGGSHRLGYGSIVAGGKNATCLHYVDNNDALKDGELLLIDAGGEFEYFTADITRTFPIGKKFSPAQARLYDLVLKSQKEVLKLCKPGTLYKEMHERACEVLTEGLLDLKLISKKEELSRFYPHNTGHWLGMDVHDVGLYSADRGMIRNRKLEPGMVFTVEPGLYCQPGDEKIPQEYFGIGIRIEDNILITSKGHEILTSEVPKERAEIEALR